MADRVTDGKTRVVWVPGENSIANIHAPTVAEVNAGLHITERITDDGMEGWEADQARVPNTSLASTTDTERMGRDKLANPMLRIKAGGSVSDTMKSTATKETLGFVAIRRGVAFGTPPAAGQAWQVVPVECGRRRDIKPEANSLERFEIPFANHTEPAYDAVMAA